MSDLQKTLPCAPPAWGHPELCLKGNGYILFFSLRMNRFILFPVAQISLSICYTLSHFCGAVQAVSQCIIDFHQGHAQPAHDLEHIIWAEIVTVSFPSPSAPGERAYLVIDGTELPFLNPQICVQKFQFVKIFTVQWFPFFQISS